MFINLISYFFNIFLLRLYLLYRRLNISICKNTDKLLSGFLDNSVASEIRNVIDDAKSKADKDR